MTTRVEPQDKYVETNGIKLHYLDWGEPGKPLIVMLHGLRGHGHTWDSFSEPMSRDYHILAFDQRGRAFSDWAPDGDYSTNAFVADLEGVCEALNLEPFILVGHSMGGRNSIAFTGRNPDKVRRLVVVDISPANSHPDTGRITNEIIGVPEEFDAFEDLYTHLRKENTLPPEDVLRRRLKYQTKELPNGKIGWRYDIAIRDARRKGTVRPSEDLWPEWERITCPILVTRGMVTDTLTPERAQEMMDRNSNAKWVEIERAHHMVMEENPDKFLEEVSAWLKT